MKANYTFSPQASAYAAVVRGWDNFNDSNDSASFMVGGTPGTREEVCAGAPRAGLALNVITGPEQKDNRRDYRTVVDLVGTYRWTEKLTQVVNFDYGAEENGAGTSAAHWSGIANYVTYCSADCLSGTVRAEWFRDSDGVRTGIQGNLYEITAGLTIQPLPKHAIFKNFYVRPELRWDFADHDGPFGGDRDDQLTAGFDLIFKFWKSCRPRSSPRRSTLGLSTGGSGGGSRLPESPAASAAYRLSVIPGMPGGTAPRCCVAVHAHGTSTATQRRVTVPPDV